MTKMMTIDLSTTCTGYAVFDLHSKKPIAYGTIKPVKKGMSKLTYPKKQLYVMRDIARQLRAVIESYTGLKLIVIEEVNAHKSRMTGKTLDGMHWILLNELKDETVNLIRYRDSDGDTGWRSRLGLRLNEMDKKVNAERRRLHKKKAKLINKKHLAARYVNGVLGTSFDVDLRESDGDVVDALGLGLSEMLTLN